MHSPFAQPVSPPPGAAPLRVGLDLDGVCYDFVAGLRHYLHTTGYPSEMCQPATRWEFFRDWGLSTSEFLQHYSAAVDAGVMFVHGDPLPGVVEGVAELRAAGCSIHIVTDRAVGTPGVAEAATRAWLERVGLDYDTLDFHADKTFPQPNLDVFIEDRLENYDALTLHGVRAVLLDRPWNRVPGDDRFRVREFGEFVTYVLDQLRPARTQ